MCVSARKSPRLSLQDFIVCCVSARKSPRMSVQVFVVCCKQNEGSKKCPGLLVQVFILCYISARKDRGCLYRFLLYAVYMYMGSDMSEVVILD